MLPLETIRCSRAPLCVADPSATYVRQLETKVKLLEGDKLLTQVGWLRAGHRDAPAHPPTAPGPTLSQLTWAPSHRPLLPQVALGRRRLTHAPPPLGSFRLSPSGLGAPGGHPGPVLEMV